MDTVGGPVREGDHLLSRRPARLNGWLAGALLGAGLAICSCDGEKAPLASGGEERGAPPTADLPVPEELSPWGDHSPFQGKRN